jgi:DnaJ-class molecular chaperone
MEGQEPQEARTGEEGQLMADNDSKRCSHCHGAGVRGGEKCGECGGTGLQSPPSSDEDGDAPKDYNPNNSYT